MPAKVPFLLNKSFTCVFRDYKSEERPTAFNFINNQIFISPFILSLNKVERVK